MGGSFFEKSVRYSSILTGASRNERKVMSRVMLQVGQFMFLFRNYKRTGNNWLNKPVGLIRLATTGHSSQRLPGGGVR
jgi:hypothetical protein